MTLYAQPSQTMTRTEFDARFAARLDDTEGYTQRQLDIINDLAFAAVADCDPDDRQLKSIVDFAFERAMRGILD